MVLQLLLLAQKEFSAVHANGKPGLLKGVAALFADAARHAEVRLAAADVLIALLRAAPEATRAYILGGPSSEAGADVAPTATGPVTPPPPATGPVTPALLASLTRSVLTPLELRVACINLACALCGGGEEDGGRAALALGDEGMWTAALRVLSDANAAVSTPATARAAGEAATAAGADTTAAAGEAQAAAPQDSEESVHHIAQRAVLGAFAQLCAGCGPSGIDALAAASPFVTLADAVTSALSPAAAGATSASFASWPGAPAVALVSASLLEALARRPAVDRGALVSAGAPRALLSLLAVGGPPQHGDAAELAQSVAVGALEALLGDSAAAASDGAASPAPFVEPAPASPAPGPLDAAPALLGGASPTRRGLKSMGASRRVILPPLMEASSGSVGGGTSPAPAAAPAAVWSALLGEAAQQGLASLSFVTLLARASAKGGDSYQSLQRLVASHHAPFSAALAPAGSALALSATATAPGSLTSVESRLVSILTSTAPHMEAARRRAAPLLWLLAVERARHTAARWGRVRRLHRLLVAYQVAEAAERLLAVKTSTNVPFAVLESYATKAACAVADAAKEGSASDIVLIGPSAPSLPTLPAGLLGAAVSCELYDWRASGDWDVSVDALGLPTYVHAPTGRAQYLTPFEAPAAVAPTSGDDGATGAVGEAAEVDPLEGLSREDALALACKVVLVAATAPPVLRLLLGVKLAPAPREDDREGLGVFLALWRAGYFRHSPAVQAELDAAAGIVRKAGDSEIDGVSAGAAAWWKDDPVIRLCTAAIAAEAVTGNEGGDADYRHPSLQGDSGASADDSGDAGDGEGEEEGENGEGDVIADETAGGTMGASGSRPEEGGEGAMLVDAESAVPAALAAGVRELQAGAGPEAIVGATTRAVRRGRHWPAISLEWDAPWVRDALACVRDAVESLEATRRGTWISPAAVWGPGAAPPTSLPLPRLPFKWGGEHLASVARLARSHLGEVVAFAAFAIRDATTAAPVSVGTGGTVSPNAAASGASLSRAPSVEDGPQTEAVTYTSLKAELPLPLPSTSSSSASGGGRARVTGAEDTAPHVTALLAPAATAHFAPGSRGTLWQFGWAPDLAPPDAKSALAVCGAHSGLRSAHDRLSAALPESYRVVGGASDGRPAVSAATASPASIGNAGGGNSSPSKFSASLRSISLGLGLLGRRGATAAGGWQAAYRGGGSASAAAAASSKSGAGTAAGAALTGVVSGQDWGLGHVLINEALVATTAVVPASAPPLIAKAGALGAGTGLGSAPVSVLSPFDTALAAQAGGHERVSRVGGGGHVKFADEQPEEGGAAAPASPAPAARTSAPLSPLEAQVAVEDFYSLKSRILESRSRRSILSEKYGLGLGGDSAASAGSTGGGSDSAADGAGEVATPNPLQVTSALEAAPAAVPAS